MTDKAMYGSLPNRRSLLKRSLTQKQTPVSPHLADTLTTSNKTPYTPLENTGKQTNLEGMRRSRSSTLLSLAALSMGATAGVLLSSHGKEAKATETNLTQPLPSEATVNPYVAVAVDEAVVSPTPVAATTPQPEIIPNTAIEHTIASGDTLWTLSEAYQVPAGEIATSNGMNDQDILEPGSRLTIPRDRQSLLTATTSDAPAATETPDFAPIAVTTNKSEQPKLATDEALELANADTKLRSKPTPKAIASSDSNTLSSDHTGEIDTTAATPEVAVTQPVDIEVETSNLGRTNNFQEPIVIPVPPPQTSTAVTATPNPLESEAVTLEVPESNSNDVVVIAEDNTNNTLANPQLLVPASEAAQVYRVQSGDTIDEIALRYGVSRSDLAEVNHLNDPHQIKVNQELRIPQPQSLNRERNQYEALIPNTELAPVNIEVETSEQADNVVVPTNTLVAQTVDTVSNWQPISVSNSEMPVETEASSSVSSNHFDRLKADIERMREEYRNERRSNTQPAETALENLSGSRSATSPTTVATAVEESNPEWQTDSNNGVIEVRVEDRRQTLTAPQVQVQPQAQSLSSSNTSVQVASAPTNPNAYNPFVNPNGQQVEPNLPPLSNPEDYLPDSLPQFNGYTWPAKGVLTSGYGRRWGRMHRGIDIAGPTGTPIVAAASGEIISAGWNSGGYGNLVDIRHPDGSMTRYAHNSKLLVRKGQWVDQGQQIALMGSTGYSTGPHLHFEVHPGGRGAANPMAYLPGR